MTATVRFSHFELVTDDLGRTTEQEIVDLADVPALIRPDAVNAVIASSTTTITILDYFDIWCPWSTVIPAAAKFVLPSTTAGGQPGLVDLKLAIESASLDEWPTALHVRAQRST